MYMQKIVPIEELRSLIEGEVLTDPVTLRTHSQDASIFEIMPEIIVYPKHKEDIQKVVHFVNKYKHTFPSLSITARSAGTCMSGGPLNTSIILDCTKYMNAIISVDNTQAIVEPGCYYRNFEKEIKKVGAMMPSYTASKELCAVGGMVSNNSGGEKTIKFGKTENFVRELEVVFSDGNVYTVQDMTRGELEEKIKENTFEGSLYQKIYSLILEHEEILTAAKPRVSKNSAGYYLWNVWDKETGIFDLCKLITGSQGTLGIITKITFKLVPIEPYSNTVAIFMPTLEHLGDIVKTIIPLKPDGFESYDDYSMKLAVRFFFDFFKYLGFWETIKLGLRFLPEAKMIVLGGVPKLTLLVEFCGTDQDEIHQKLVKVAEKMRPYGFKTHIAKNAAEAEKYWKIRHESFNMLRRHMTGRRTAPFIDDIIVRPEHMTAFLPRLQALLNTYKLTYTIAGHAGDGNFHIIPLMDLSLSKNHEIIIELSKKVYDLVLEYKGSITAEHNDGIIRTPFLEQMYGKEVTTLFKDVKEMFDPHHIFNPKKKVGGTFEDIKKYMRTKNE